MSNDKKRVGRPNRPELEVRDKRITVRLNNGENYCLHELADLNDVSSTEMIRRLIRNEYIKNFC